MTCDIKFKLQKRRVFYFVLLLMIVFISLGITTISSRGKIHPVVEQKSNYSLTKNIKLHHCKQVNQSENTNASWHRTIPEKHNASTSCRKVHTQFPILGGRLGNQIFLFTASLGLAKLCSATAVISKHSVVSAVFKTSVEMIDDKKKSTFQSWRTWNEKSAHIYDDMVLQLCHETGENINFRGYFQSWKYFEDPLVHRIIKRELNFKELVLEKAQNFISNIRCEYPPKRTSQLFIGVHIRRGDMVNSNRGYTVAPRRYIMDAMEYFTRKYISSDIVFIICTDAPSWVRTELHDTEYRTSLSEGNSAGTDLAILSLCNHTIMTVGSFGWWGAWLAGGDTVYYGGYPLPHSKISRIFKAEDYYPPHWIRRM